MIVLTVLSYNGERAQGPTAQFDELGGTIGRADTNQLVLPDPERTISRVHARIVFRGGRFFIVDSGSNPISLNGLVVGAGREQPLAPGDSVQIGGYVIGVGEAAPAVEDDPFADLFSDVSVGLAAPSGLAPAMPAPAAAPPLQPLPPLPPAPAWPPPAVPPAARGGAAAASAIPDDWDPFAPDAATDPVAEAAAGLPASAAPVVQAPVESLDDLFGLSAGPGLATPLDPLGGSPAQALAQPPNMAAAADPVQSLVRTATLMPPSAPDHDSELNTPMILPASLPQPAALPPGAVLSWDDPPAEGRVVTLPGVHKAEPAGALPVDATAALPLDVTAPLPPDATAPLPVDAPAPRPRPEAAEDAVPASRPPAPAPVVPPSMAARPAAAPMPRTVPTQTPAPAPAASAPPDELLAALLQGLNTPGLNLTELTPDTMRLIGQLLRESMHGAVELLVARAAFKREMRAEMTMIVTRENNPLKFSPTVEVAINHLLGRPTPGFMPGAPAVRDAFDDLRAHQLGVMAGMRAALEGVLKRFDPQQLEGKLTRKKALDSLIPGSRKARLWELFQELFTQLQKEAEDDFDELFGKAFLRAYEAQLDRLQGETDR